MKQYEDIKLSPSEAFDIYIEKFPNTIVKEIELKLNQLVYEVEGYDEERKYELDIDAVTGHILEIEIKFFKGTYDQITREVTEKINPMVKQALKDAGEGSQLYEYELDIEDRRLELEVKITLANGQYANHKYDLDTGELIRRK